MNGKNQKPAKGFQDDEFIVLDEADDPLQPSPVTSPTPTDESPLTQSLFKNIFTHAPNPLSVSQSKPPSKYQTPQHSERAQKEWLPVLAKFQDSWYYPFLERCSFITCTSCNFYEPLLNTKLSATVLVTNFCLLVDLDYTDSRVLYTKEYFVVPYPAIDELRFPSKQMLNSRRLGEESSDFENLLLMTKDFRLVHLCANNNRNLFREIPNRLYTFNSHQNFFGLSFKEAWAHDCQLSFDIVNEFRRQGVRCEYENIVRETKNKDKFPFQILENLSARGKICDTYPKFVIVPAAITREHLLEIASFRAHERIPILTYHWRERKANLWRSGQCKSGLSKSRCSPDEFLVSLMHNQFAYNSIPEMHNGFERQRHLDVHLYDARDRLAVFGNMLSGKGSENPSYYRNCNISFNNLPNMSSIQATFAKLVSCLTNLEKDGLGEIKEWLESMALVLQLTAKIIKSMSEGVSVFVHCSDGWDRTSQVCALAQLAIDPYFRTINGFIDLINKEFVFLGHQFAKRNGMATTDRSQFSPIYVQFMNCVLQIVRRTPAAFEFNEIFLQEMTLFVYSGVFGEFLGNHFQERDRLKLDIKYVSLYEFADRFRKRYENPTFGPMEDKVLFVPTKGFNLFFWKELFYGWVRQDPNLELEVPLI
jgi:hypothetical protein